jgi:hypothetical protein
MDELESFIIALEVQLVYFWTRLASSKIILSHLIPKIGVVLAL